MKNYKNYIFPARSRATRWYAALIFLIGIAIPFTLRADVMIEETHNIASGWNFIRLALEPVEKDPLKAINGIDWQSLWAWIPNPEAARGGRWVSCDRDAP